MTSAAPQRICAVAIVRDEGPFVDEWLAYHRLIGIDHFFLYDDDPALPLAASLTLHAAYTTVVPWYGRSQALPGRNRQTKAYWHATENYAQEFSWVTFIDIDEFVVVRESPSLPAFLNAFHDVHAITLNWHIFGHNGFFEDPQGLITTELVRRMAMPSPHGKTISRPDAIAAINSAHQCVLKKGSSHVDANHRPYTSALYPDKSRKAHINHYQCRSFTRWMRRVDRGDASVDAPSLAAQEHLWRVDRDACLRQFVETVALNKNEFVDEFMRKYAASIRHALDAGG